MANVLVLLELRHGAVLPVSLEALGQARRVATSLGATLYALVPLPEAPTYGEDDIIALCARHGADKVVLLTDDRLGSEGEMRYGTHGRAVLAACEQLPPTLLILGASAGARDLAPRVAARLGALYLPEGWVSMQAGQLVLCDRAGRPLTPNEDEEGAAGGLEHTAVITVPPGRYQVAVGADEAEMVIVAAPPGKPDFAEVGRVLSAAAYVVGEGAEAVREAFVLSGAGDEDAAGPTLAPPGLVVALDAAVPPLAGAIRVAAGEGAAGQVHAHYALPMREAATALVEALSWQAPTIPEITLEIAVDPT